jgi:hypothetical protein
MGIAPFVLLSTVAPAFEAWRSQSVSDVVPILRLSYFAVGESGGPHALVHPDHRLLGAKISASESVEVAVYVILS